MTTLQRTLAMYGLTGTMELMIKITSFEKKNNTELLISLNVEALKMIVVKVGPNELQI